MLHTSARRELCEFSITILLLGVGVVGYLNINILQTTNDGGLVALAKTMCFRN